MVDANWMPFPGLIVALAGLVAMSVLAFSNWEGAYRERLWVVAKAVCLAGVAALCFGVAIALALTGVS
jgi:hypothetical protein